MEIIEYKGGKLYRSQARFFEQLEKFSPKKLRIKHFCRTSNDSYPPLNYRTIELLCKAGGGVFNINITSYNSYVVGLSLFRLNLKEIPDSINAFKKLTYMMIDRSSLLESLPNTIGELDQLQTLRVTCCPKLKIIPDNIGTLKSLKILDLSGCNIEKIPDSIGDLLKLEYLGLDGNKIANLPKSIGQLKNLISLNLGEFTGNNLTDLPDSIGQLNNLIKLYIRYNKLQRLPDSIGNLALLEELILAKNNLTLIPETIGKLKSLKELRVSKNYLQTLPNSIRKLEAIEIIDLSSNQIGKLPEVLKYLSKSTNIILEDNPLNNKLIIESKELLEKLVNKNLCGHVFTWNNKDASLIGDIFEGMKRTVINCDNANVYSYHGPHFGKDNVLVIGSKDKDDAINLLMEDFLSEIDPGWIDELRAKIESKGDLESYLKATFSKNLEKGFSTDIYIGTLTDNGEDYIDFPTSLKKYLEQYRIKK